MPDVNQSERLTAQLETSAMKTREQPRVSSLDVIPQTEQAKILASILDMGEALIVADQNENLLVFNPAAERMFGAGATAAKNRSGICCGSPGATATSACARPGTLNSTPGAGTSTGSRWKTSSSSSATSTAAR